ncbi:hypothetical protein GF343_04465 [Candidatus Woesearchaeota archaeon]|nr:hypothetical protein [Candidatus Woesearchaeota archaeon]
MKKELMLILCLLVLTSCSSQMTGGFNEPIAPCRDTDGGANFYRHGKAIDYYMIHNDYCAGNTLFEGVCATFQRSGYVIHECENGCQKGVCKQKNINTK